MTWWDVLLETESRMEKVKEAQDLHKTDRFKEAMDKEMEYLLKVKEAVVAQIPDYCESCRI